MRVPFVAWLKAPHMYWRMVSSGKVIVAVPVKNEVDRIGACIAALAAQSRHFDKLLLFLNDCTDGTFDACHAKKFGIDIEIVQCRLPPSLASAGEARRLALASALEVCPDGVILTTDADAVPDSTWIAKNLDAIGHGADMVCGQACLFPDESKRLPSYLHHDDASEISLLNLLDEMDALIDPNPFDPWPRHQHNSGASIAMRAQTLRQAGGAPHVSSGEDRALVAQFRKIDARIRHDPDIVVPVSARLDGRAENGMAATLKRRMETRDAWTDERLEPAVDWYRRCLAKARLRAAWQDKSEAESIAADLLISKASVTEALQTAHFGTAWEMVQAASPVLHRRRVAFANINREIRQAMQLRDMLVKDVNQRADIDAGKLAVG